MLDEPVSALDLSIQAQVLNLLMICRRRSGWPISSSVHDLSVVRHIADDVMVMYLGRPVETGPARKSSPIRSIPIRQPSFGDARRQPDGKRERIQLQGDCRRR